MSTHFTQQIELKFWQVVIPQLTPAKPLGKALRKINEMKASVPFFRFCTIAFTGCAVGTLGGVALFNILH